MSRGFKITILIVTAAVIVFAAMLGVYAVHSIADISIGDTVMVQGLEKESPNVGMVNVLLIGVDEDGTRSDTIMLASVDGFSNRVNIMSIPRDTLVKPEGYTSQKINALIGIGQDAVKKGRINEPEELLITEVKELTGLPIHYFASLDFAGFKDIINALDGVYFNVPYDMNYDDPTQNLHIHLKAGQQHLDGQAAHDFVRFRHNNGGSAPGEYVMGDEGREYWQQQFIKEFVKQKFKPQYLSKIDDIYEVISENVRTNYTMRDLLNHLDLIQKIDINCIGSYQLPGNSEYFTADGHSQALWWYIYDEKATRELVNSVFLPMTPEEWAAYKAEHEAELKNSASGFDAISELHESRKSASPSENVGELENSSEVRD